MITLALDASTYRGSVAVIRDGEVIAEAEAEMRGATEERLMPAVAEALSQAGTSIESIGAVVCGAGPGSFTSLRIAGSIAKGIALARSVPLYGVSSLALLVASAPRDPGAYLAAVDALRGEWYVDDFLIDSDGQVSAKGGAGETPHRIVSTSQLVSIASSHPGRLLGVVVHPPIGVTDVRTITPSRDHRPLARGVVGLRGMIGRTPAVDLGGWEPTYGRLAEAQVKWEAAHGRALQT